MAIIKQLKEYFTKQNIYPVTVTNAVFDTNGNRLSEYLNGNLISSDDVLEEIEDAIPIVADRIGEYTAEQIGDVVDNFDNKLSEYLSTHDKLNILTFGVDNSGESDCSDILNKVFSSSDVRNKTIYFPKGEYLIRDTLNIVECCNLELDNNARIYTDTSLEYLIKYNSDRVTSVSIKNHIKGGIFDGNDLVDIILGLEYYTNFTIDDVKIYNFKSIGIKCSTTDGSTTHGGLMVSHALIRNWNNAYVCSIGILNDAQDNKFFDNVIVNTQIGIDTNFATIRNIHHWISFTDILPDSIFCINRNSYTTISDCCIDTVLCAVKSMNCQTRIINSTMFLNPTFYTDDFAVSNVATFAKRDSSGYVYAINCLFYLSSGTGLISEYTTSMDKYFSCRFTPESKFDMSNYNPLETLDYQLTVATNDDVNILVTRNMRYKLSGGNANLPEERSESGILDVIFAGNMHSTSRFITQIYYPQSTPHVFYMRRYTESTQTFSKWSKYSGTEVS